MSNIYTVLSVFIATLPVWAFVFLLNKFIKQHNMHNLIAILTKIVTNIATLFIMGLNMSTKNENNILNKILDQFWATRENNNPLNLQKIIETQLMDIGGENNNQFFERILR